MREITLSAGTKSTILCGRDAFLGAIKKIPFKKIFVITDSNVYGYYKDLLKSSFPKAFIYVLPAGERSKNYKNLFDILNKMAKDNLNRSSCVIAFGGGVGGVIGWLAASLYLRGVHFIQVGTSLLAQVDSSVGGKTAVDLGEIKNAVGTFYQPEIVVADPMFLKTLPMREMRCGMGEIVKYAAIDKGIYEKLSTCSDPYDISFIEDIIYDCIQRKADAVIKDEKDINGIRRLLNAGHTVGHSLELVQGLRSHGEYVAIGLFYEMYISKKTGNCSGAFFSNFEKLIRLVVPQMPSFDKISKAAKVSLHDKKNEQEGIVKIVAPKSEGECIEISLPFSEYKKYLIECETLSKEEKPIKLGLIGRDVTQSTSNIIHPFICKALGYNITFEKISIPPENFESQIGEVLSSLSGFNVTIPYKLSIIAHLKKLLGDAKVFGAVNTVLTKDLSGYNTDGEGFRLMLENAGVVPCGKNVLLIGAGGAGRSVAYKLKEMGANVYVFSLHGKSAKDVATSFGLQYLEKPCPGKYDIIVNASGVGMHESVGSSPVGEDILASCYVAIDLIYEPEETEFLRLAKNMGKKTINGRAMLFYQAYYADCAFLGLEADAKTAKKLFDRYLKEIVK